jgi:hypothetical protein
MGLSFGGFKSSGSGRQEGLDELLGYARIKSTSDFSANGRKKLSHARVRSAPSGKWQL